MSSDEPSTKKARTEETVVPLSVEISSEFNKNLAQLPDTSNVLKITLTKKSNDEEVAVIENKPGSTGSIRVYSYLLKLFGGEVTRQAAYVALALYAEHTEDAHLHPGKHGNIDRLLNVVSTNETLVGKVEMKPDSE